MAAFDGRAAQDLGDPVGTGCASLGMSSSAMAASSSAGRQMRAAQAQEVGHEARGDLGMGLHRQDMIAIGEHRVLREVVAAEARPHPRAVR
jgi:hypothetical protein